MQSAKDIIKPTLLDDAFLLHTCLEENISENVGNDVFLSINGFMKYLPPKYTKLLQDSQEIVDKLRDFRIRLMNLKIDYKRMGYDNFDEEIVKLSYNISAEPSNNKFEKELLQRERKQGRISNENGEFFIMNESEDIYNSDEEAEDEGGTYVDKSVEEEFNNKLDEIVDLIVTKSKNKNIFVPVGYKQTWGDGHSIGLVVSQNEIAVCNGGDGIQYHYMQPEPEQEAGSGQKVPRYPQCIIKLKRPDDEFLKQFVRDLIIISRQYTNTDVNCVYFNVLKLYIKQETDEHQYNYDETILSIIKDLFSGYVSKNAIGSTSLFLKRNTQSTTENPLLKYPKYVKFNGYGIEFSDKINYNLEDFYKRIFSPKYLTEIKKPRSDMIWDDIFREIDRTFEKMLGYTNDTIKRILLKSKTQNTWLESINKQIAEKISQYINLNLDIIVSDIETINGKYIIDIDKFVGLMQTFSDKYFYIPLFNTYIDAVLSGSLHDNIFDQDIEQYNKEKNIDFYDIRQNHRNENMYGEAYNEIKGKIMNKYQESFAYSEMGKHFLPIEVDVGLIRAEHKKIIANNFLPDAFNENIKEIITNNLIAIYTDNIIGISGSIERKDLYQKHIIEFITDLIFNDIKIKDTKHTKIENFTILFDATGKNLFDQCQKKEEQEYEYGEEQEQEQEHKKKKSLKETKNKMAKMLMDKFSFLKSVCDEQKIPSLDKEWGYVREQFSGSCTYNGVLLAIYDTLKEIKDISTYHIKHIIESNLLEDKLRQIESNEITLKYTDKTVIDTLEVSAINEYNKILELVSNEEQGVKYRKYAKYTLDKKIGICDKLRKYLPYIPYPTITISQKPKETISVSQKADDKNFWNKLTTIDDIIENIKLIVDHKLLDPIFYTNNVMSKIIAITRKFAEGYSPEDDSKRSKIFTLYTAMTENIKSISSQTYIYESKDNMAINITVIYIMLYCFDLLLFFGYNPSLSRTEMEYFDLKENNLLRNLTMSASINNDDLNYMITLIQRYELFYPFNNDDYYIKAINSLINSFKSKIIKNPELDVEIDMNESIDRINTELLKIQGFVNLYDHITEKFSKQEKYHQREKGVRTINELSYSEKNLDLCNKISKLINKMKEEDEISIGLNQLFLDHDSDSTIWTNVADRERHRRILFHFRFNDSNSFPDNFTFDIKQKNYRKSVHYRIHLKSNTVILNLENLNFSPGEFVISVPDIKIMDNGREFEISELFIFEMDRWGRNDEFYNLFNSAHTRSEILSYKSQPLGETKIKNIIDFDEIYRIIRTGDLEEAKSLIESHYYYKSARYTLFPIKSKEEMSVLKFYSLSEQEEGWGKKIQKVEHNLYNTTDYLDYYRSAYQKMMSDPLIKALEHNQHKHVYELLLEFDNLLFEKPMMAAPSSIQSPSNNETNGQIILSIKNINKITSGSVASANDDENEGENENEGEAKSYNFYNLSNLMPINIGTRLNYVIDGFTPIYNEKELLEVIQNRTNDVKSVTFLENMVRICKEIDNCFIATKTDNSEIREAILCVPMSHRTIKEKNYTVHNYPWNHIEMQKSRRSYDDDDNNNMIKPSIQIDDYKLDYVKFSNNSFEMILPNVNLLDEESVEMFVNFCYHLLMNQAYKILNMYLPLLVSIYHNSSYPEGKFCIRLIDFILDKKYFNSPYNYYFLNKLYLMIHGEFNNEFVYDLSKRQSYYQSIYTSIYPESEIIEYNVDFTLFDTWIKIISEHVEKKFISSKILLSAIDTLEEIVEKHKYVYKYFVLDDVLKYSNIYDYLMDKTNYNQGFINLQLDMIKHLKNTAKSFTELSEVNEEEIIGNIKYYISPSFDHNGTSNNINASIKLFELVTGKIVDNTQYQFINNMINDEATSEYKVYELLMGRGKSYVIIPCILLIYYFNKKFQNIIECVPSHLLTQSNKIMSKFLPFMTCGFIHNMNVTRGDNASMSKIIDVMDSKISKIIITTDTAIKTNFLANIEDERQPQKSQAGGKILSIPDKGYIEIDKQYEKIKELTDQIWIRLESKRKNLNKGGEERYDFPDNTILVVDEFDMIIDPLRSDLNFPISEYENVNFQDVLIRIVLNITNELFTKYHTYMLKSDRTDEKLNKLIIRKIMLEMKNVKYDAVKDMMNKLYSSVVKKMNKDGNIEQFNVLRKKENLKIKKYFEPNVTSGLKGGNPPDSLLLYYIRETYNIYCSVLSLLLDKDYGWDDEDSNNPFIAIPYSAQDTPMKGSQYSEIIINIILTSITYFQKGLREIDVKNFIAYIKFITKKMGNYKAKQFLDLDEKLVDFALIDSNDGFAKYVHYLYDNNYPQYVGTICVYLEKNVLIQYVKIDPKIMNCSFIDIIDPSYIRTKFALSGTVNIHLPQFRFHGSKDVLKKVIRDDLTRANIEKALRGENMKSITSSNVPEVITINSNSNITDIINLMINYQILIDTGSFLRYFTNLSMAEQLSAKFKDHVIVFFDENDVPKIIKNNSMIDYDLKLLKHEKQYKVYYDQKHMVGIDLDLPSNAKGLITVYKFNTHTQIAQGLFRMREINYYQSHDYLIKDDTKEIINNIMANKINNIDSRLGALLYCLDQNEENRFKMAKYKYLQQTILCLFRILTDHDNRSYDIDLFVPSLDDNRILTDYNFNYVKDHFITMMNNRLDSFNQRNEYTDKILKEIQKLMQLFRATDTMSSAHSVQKQSESIKSINYNINLEINHRSERSGNIDIQIDNLLYNDILKKINCIDLAINNYLDDCKDIKFKVNIQIPYYNDNKGTKEYFVIGLFDIIQKNGITISPDALMTLYNMFGKATNKLFYKSYNTKTKVTTLITSADLLVLRVSSHIDKLAKLQPLVEFTNDVVNNLLMLLCFNIPVDDDVDKLVSSPIIYHNKAHIKNYFDKYYKYKLASISPEFNSFLNS